MQNTTIYSLKDPVTDKIRYVGKTIETIDKRLKRHLSNCYLQSVTRKINWIKSLKEEGLEPIIEVLDVVNTEKWEFWEKYWIARLKAQGFDLTNTTDGGGGYGCLGHSKDIGRKISEAKKGVKFSKEHCRNLGLAKLGSKHPMFGKHISEETRIKMRKAAIGRKGQRCGRKKILQQSIPILQYDLDGNFIRGWIGIAEAVRSLKLNNETNIRHVLKGKYKTAYGYIWKYKLN